MVTLKLQNYRADEKRELAFIITRAYRDFREDFCPHTECSECKYKYLCDDLRRMANVATQKSMED